ncbi:hypothetical protein [Nocardia sp. NPDC005998]|uniref:hypothetical protein n=1 Tax=Nocardia sp. NPDC005998 TaxID=3156894 RepID=UPI0033B6679B
MLLSTSAPAVADARCGGQANAHLRLNPDDIRWVIAAGLLWVASLVGIALVSRKG